MAIESLSAREKEIVLHCLKATAAQVDDWEKHARLGIEADDLQQVIARWPNIDDHDENSAGFLAINNSMNEVCHGFHIQPAEWSIWFDAAIDEIKATYRKWLALKKMPGGIR